MPLTATNLLADWDPDAGSYSDAGSTPAGAGDLLYQGNDQSGNGYHLVQATSGSRPTVQVVDGKKVWDWDSAAGTKYLANASIPFNQRAFTFFGVLNPVRNIATRWMYGFTGNGLAGVTGSDGFAGNTVPHLPGRPAVYVQRHGTTRRRVCIDTRIYEDTLIPAAATGTGLEFGRLFGGGSNAWAGTLWRVAMYGAEISDADVDANIAYLMATYPYMPATATKKVICDGDSLTQGQSTQGDPGPAQLSRALGLGWEVFNAGLSGMTIAGRRDSRGYLEIYPLARQTNQEIVVTMLGVNDVLGGRTALQMEADWVAYATAIRSQGKRIIVLTVTPGASQSVRDTFNTWLRANWATYADALVDFAADARMSTAGPTTYYADSTGHLTAAGAAVYAELVKPAVLAQTTGGGSGGRVINGGLIG